MRSDDFKTALKVLAVITGGLLVTGALTLGAVFASTMYI